MGPPPDPNLPMITDPVAYALLMVLGITFLAAGAMIMRWPGRGNFFGGLGMMVGSTAMMIALTGVYTTPRGATLTLFWTGILFAGAAVMLLMFARAAQLEGRLVLCTVHSHRRRHR